jgi:hypothetical protein
MFSRVARFRMVAYREDVARKGTPVAFLYIHAIEDGTRPKEKSARALTFGKEVIGIRFATVETQKS